MSKKKQPNCGVCNSLKRIYIQKSGKEKLVCDKCRNKKSSEWQKQNKERANEKNRRWAKENSEQKYFGSRSSKLKQNYNLSVDDYNEMMIAQNNVCKICKQEETQKNAKGTNWSLSVDHCHSTGKVRALLCSKCNVGLSKFRENITYLENAINYLKEFKNELLS